VSTTTDSPTDSPPEAGADHGGTDDVVLPWWQNPWNLAALTLAGLILGLGIGFWIGDRTATTSGNRVDVGFLQDMRFHHDQAVAMSYFYLTEVPEPHPRLSLLAEEIFFSQQLEAGRMVQLLREMDEIEANDTGTAMAWMDEPTPIDRMPGIASQDELNQLAAAAAAGDSEEASRVFATLMIAHHQGGLHMAEHAVEHGSNDEVVAMARGMITGQQAEIAELQRVLDSLGDTAAA
jgi:uncharacterized protein (DUF305 family)